MDSIHIQTRPGICRKQTRAPTSTMPKHDDARALSLMEHCQQTLEHAPGSVDAWLSLGLMYLYDQRYDDAVVALQRATLVRNDHAGAWVAYGWGLLFAGDLSDARRAFERASSLDTGLTEALAGLAAVLIRQGESRQARQLVEQALSLDESNVGAQIAMAMLMHDDGGKATMDVFARLLPRPLAVDRGLH